MNVPKPEDLPQCPHDDKELNRDSNLSPTFSSHAEDCSWVCGLCIVAEALPDANYTDKEASSSISGAATQF